MVFASEIFIFLYLPVFLVLYYLTPTAYRSWTILIGSYIFYAWWRVDFLLLFFAVTVWAFAFGQLIAGWDGQARGRLALAIGIVGCLVVLGIFKYLNFFVDSFAAMLGTTKEDLGYHWQLILPIGVSFYVFHAIGYMVDVYRRDTPATTRFIDFAAFMALFPHMIAGPVLRFKDLTDQFRYREQNLTIFASGCYIFTIGLAKKVLLADAVAPVANQVFGSADPTLVESWAGAIAYMLQLYFDFSGYSDMAVGLALMMGFRFKPNFNMPYLSRSITEFWQRWHISLSTWLRDYLYVPLGGNRKGKARTYLNLFLVMVLGGFWHGASWTFILWGAWHGLWLVIERLTGWSRVAAAYSISLPMTLLAALIGWVLFRAATLTEALTIYQGMLGLSGFLPRPEFLAGVTNENLLFILVASIVVFAEPHLRRIWNPEIHADEQTVSVSTNGTATLGYSFGFALAMSGLFLVSVAKLTEQSVSPFLYFQF
jgi:alginate O-acetyltransferase complex protein AlgI